MKSLTAAHTRFSLERNFFRRTIWVGCRAHGPRCEIRADSVRNGRLHWAACRNSANSNSHPLEIRPHNPLLVVWGFGSHHSGGAHFVFGDGRVRFVNEKILPQVFQQLGHRADGQFLGDF